MFLLLLICFISSLNAQTNTARTYTFGGQTYGFSEYVPPAYPSSPIRKYPLIIFLHGNGERGNGTTELSRLNNQPLPQWLAAGARMTFTDPTTSLPESFMVLSPQLPSTAPGWTNNYIDAMISWSKTNLQVDTQRIYLMGLSAGVGGIMRYTTTSVANANRIAAVVQAAMICDWIDLCNINRSGLPTWSFGNADDWQYSGVQCLSGYYDGLIACTPTPPIAPKKTVYPGGSGDPHNSWNKAFDTGHTYQSPQNVYEWMLQYKRNGTPPPPPDAGSFDAKAGADQSTDAAYAVYLNGANSTGNIATYSWTKVSGPAQFNLVSPNGAGTFLNSLVAGVYTFRLTITEAVTSAVDFDDVVITVTGGNQQPLVDAGQDVTIVSPASTSVTLGATASDPDGTIVSYSWTKLSGPTYTINNANISNPIISNLLATGTPYVFRLTVTDNQGGTNFDDITITVNDNTNVKIPIQKEWIYQNNNFSNDLDNLFDGVIDGGVIPGYGQILNPYEAWIEFPEQMNVQVRKFRFYDGQGSFEGTPLKIYGIMRSSPNNWNKVLLATFTGSTYLSWVQVDLPTPQPIKYLVLEISYAFGGHSLPVEMEIYGTYSPYTMPALKPLPKVKFQNYLGTNMYEWNLLQNDIFPFVSWEPYEPKWDVLKHFHVFRHYLDWNKIEMEQGTYSFQPTRDGAWNLDTLYQRIKSTGHEVIVDLKALPKYILDTYPPGQQDKENAPLDAYNLDPNLPGSYLRAGKMFFQFAARYGATAVDTNLLSVYTVPAYVGAAVNVKMTGLNYVNIIEMENERDKWWKGRKGYQSGREYAAYASAVYDGHLGTLGPNVGIKTADPTMKVAMAGVAQPTPDYIRGIVDWCKQYRNDSLPFDYINYHMYSNDAGSTQYNGAQTRGIAPELGRLADVANTFNTVSQHYAHDRPVIQTEHGYDIMQESPQKAIPIGSKDEFATQADWSIRSMLSYARTRHKYFTTYEFGDNAPGSPAIFLTSGFINGSLKRPSLDFVEQFGKVLGQWEWDTTIHHDPEVDIYTNGIAKRYVIWEASENGSIDTFNYKLAVHNNKIKTFTPKIGSSDMDQNYVTVVGDSVSLTATETPLIFEERSTTQTFAAPTVNTIADITITLPNNSTTLDATATDPDGSTLTYEWSKVSGNNIAYRIHRPYAKTTTLDKLIQGTYVFKVNVADTNGKVSTDNITVTVNNAPGNTLPISNAGVDTVIYTDGIVTLDAGGSSDPDGTIAGYYWNKVSGPHYGIIQNPYNQQTIVYFNAPGAYVYELYVTDNKGGTSIDTKNVQVITRGVDPLPNQLPIARVISSKVIKLPINTATLQDNGSSDPDGNIASYVWTKITGPSTFTLTNGTSPTATLTNLVTGTYVFRLTVTDNVGTTDTADVIIEVQPADSNVKKKKYLLLNFKYKS